MAPVHSEIGLASDVELVMSQVVDASIDDRFEVTKHARSRLPRPAEDKVDTHSEPEAMAPRDRVKDLSCLLPSAAHRNHVIVELLHSDADACAARGTHSLELVPREELRNAFESDFRITAPNAKQIPDGVKQPRILIGTVQIRSAASEVHARKWTALQKRPV